MTSSMPVSFPGDGGTTVHLFHELVYSCPRLEWLDMDLLMDRRLHRSPSGEEMKVDWPVDRERLKVVYHHTPEGEGRLNPWRWFKGNVEVVEDAQEIEESKKEAEAKWMVSPYESVCTC